MTDRLVTVAVWILAGCFALACVAFAWRAGQSPAGAAAGVAAGESAWQAHCARCHAASEFAAPLAGAARAATAGRWLVELEHHGRASFADDVAILHWLSLQAEGVEREAKPAESEAPDDGDEEEDFSL